MAEQEHIPIERQLISPLLREDGVMLDMHINDSLGYIRISLGSEDVLYANEEIVLLGGGDFEIGIERVKGAYFLKPISMEEIDDEEDRAFEGEIIKARAEGKLPLPDDKLH